MLVGELAMGEYPTQREGATSSTNSRVADRLTENLEGCHGLRRACAWPADRDEKALECISQSVRRRTYGLLVLN
jgi:hypothetical protein